jgi:hypothetical protein
MLREFIRSVLNFLTSDAVFEPMAGISPFII